MRPSFQIAAALAVIEMLPGCAVAKATADTNAGAVSPAMLPDRLLSCVLGRATNLDPHRVQKRSEVIYEGRHNFAILLPARPMRTTPPPDATEPPEPVDPRTRIIADPDGLTNAVPSGFDRVIDMWPERVEMTTTIVEPMVNLIIVSDISADGTTANLFMTKATDLATLDLKNVYSGPCRVTSTSRDAA